MTKTTQTIDSIEYEVFETTGAKILIELPIEYGNDEEVTKAESTTQAKLFVGELNGKVAFMTLDKNTGKISGDLLLEKPNRLFIAESIEKIIGAEKPWDERLELKEGEDDLHVFMQSSWSHNLPAPFERIVIRNRRRYLLDGLRSHLLGLELPIKAAEKLAAKIRELTV